MNPFTEQERLEIRETFGVLPEHLDAETFRKTLRELRARFHPDNFEKFGDDTVRQLATERFQRIERLAEKIDAWLSGKLQPALPGPSAPDTDQRIFDPRARFAYREMKIEIRTGDKDLKYHLFGTFYRWLTLGDRFKIPDTQAFLIADEEHLGRRIGFVESIRVYLTFEENDSVEVITRWLFSKIEGRADALLIEGELVPIAYEAILLAIKRRSFKLLASETA
ncbi:MAG: hypothetical protein DYG98_03685 [Haliscomenobacteraceae bacterium CHB4]|nr:hypothetical protein [Haliscomenobacteraceae bacterium CHB4]